MSDGPHPYRQYVGLALVIIAYVGGIIGWSCAVRQVEERPSTAVDTTPPYHSDTDLSSTGAHRLSSLFPAAERRGDADLRWERRPGVGRDCAGGSRGTATSVFSRQPD